MRLKRKNLIEKAARERIFNYAGEMGITISVTEQVFMSSIILKEKHEYLLPNRSHFMWYALGIKDEKEYYVCCDLRQANTFAIPKDIVENLEDYDSEFIAEDYRYKKYFDYQEDCDVYIPD